MIRHMNHPPVFTHMTSPEVHGCRTSPSDAQTSRMSVPPSAVPTPSTPSSAPLPPTLGQIPEYLYRQETRQKKHLITDKTVGLSAGSGLSTAPVRTTTTTTDLQCLVAPVFNCSFTPGFLQPTGQPPASQHPYDFSAFGLATHLHYPSATVRDVIQTYLFIFSYSL